MHFSSIAVNLLAQSVPLLAVGHIAGWKKREERSRVQSRRLRDALLMGGYDKKGVLFEKHIGVLGKLNDVLKKKRSGSVRLVQDSASSDVPSDDLEASVECDPLSKVTDSGIFGCGMDSHCVESEESKLGGFCASPKEAPSINRALQQNASCVARPYPPPDLTCDCSQFNETSQVGNFTCTGPFCYGEACGTISYSLSYNADGSYATDDACFNIPFMGIESLCYSYSSDSPECEIKANGVVCTSCEFNQTTCPANSTYPKNGFLLDFDCTNTVLNIEANTCNALVITSFLDAAETGAPSDSGMGTGAPMETGPPSASPDDMPSSATSSGSCHTAKVPIVVSAAAVAWMASFGN